MRYILRFLAQITVNLKRSYKARFVCAIQDNLTICLYQAFIELIEFTMVLIQTAKVYEIYTKAQLYIIFSCDLTIYKLTETQLILLFFSSDVDVSDVYGKHSKMPSYILQFLADVIQLCQRLIWGSYESKYGTPVMVFRRRPSTMFVALCPWRRRQFCPFLFIRFYQKVSENSLKIVRSRLEG